MVKEGIVDSEDMAESALYGLKLHIDRYGEAVTDILRRAGIQVMPSPKCFRVIHTSFRGNMKELLQQIPALSDYPVKQYKWWNRISDSIKRDQA